MSLLQQRFVQPISNSLKKFLFASELQWLLYSLFLFWLTLSIEGMWPWPIYGFFIPYLGWPLALVCLVSIVILQSDLNTEKLKQKIVSWIAGGILILAMLLGVVGGTFAGYLLSGYTDVETGQLNGSTYHLMAASPVEGAGHFELYKCAVFDVICPRIEIKFHRRARSAASNDYHLKYNGATNKLELWSKDDQFIFNFDKT